MTQVRQTAPPGLEEYNPFADAKSVSTWTFHVVSVSANITQIHQNYSEGLFDSEAFLIFLTM